MPSGTAMSCRPPWQSMHASRTAVSCIVCESVPEWQTRHDFENAATSAASARPRPDGDGGKLKPSCLAVCVVGRVVADHIVLTGPAAPGREFSLQGHR